MLNLGANSTTLYMFHSTSVIKRTVYQGWREFLSGLRQYQKSGLAVLLELHPCSRHIYSPPPHLPLLVVELNTCMFISYTEMCFSCFFSLAGYAADTTLGKCVKQVPSGSARSRASLPTWLAVAVTETLGAWVTGAISVQTALPAGECSVCSGDANQAHQHTSVFFLLLISKN